MTSLLVFLALFIGIVIGFLTGRGRSNVTTVENPEPHPLADGLYFSVVLDGVTHWFTGEQLVVAEERAKRLTS
jgi:hypothetical protein